MEQLTKFFISHLTILIAVIVENDPPVGAVVEQVLRAYSTTVRKDNFRHKWYVLEGPLHKASA